MSLPILIAPLLVVVLVPLAMGMISRGGWAALAQRYRANGRVPGMRIGVISAAVNHANYKNSILLRCSREGFYLRPVFIFRLFHPPVFIPWSEIAGVADRSVLRGNTKELVIGSPEIARITVLESTYARMETARQQEITAGSAGRRS